MDKVFPIAEIFKSIQGEGPSAGSAAIFIRFAGCDSKCPFCDTVIENVEAYSERVIIEKVQELSNARPIIVLTGGNPCIQELDGLIDKLVELNYPVHVETQGTILPSWLKKVDHITISPKGVPLFPLVEYVKNELKRVPVVFKPLVMINADGSIDIDMVKYAQYLIAAADRKVIIQLGDCGESQFSYGVRYHLLCEALLKIEDFESPNVSIMPQVHKIGGLR